MRGVAFLARKAGAALVVLPALIAGAVMAQNRQPISTSLAECAVIHEELVSVARRRGKPEGEVEKLVDDAVLFRTAAWSEARREGRHDPKAHVAAQGTRLGEKWQGQFGNIFRLRKNKDWIDYCHALGKSRGVLNR
ncbi:hypothetical protein [Marimonas arenosa]|uniref:Uncharacterized protein n=1 Tax=Marimonas arenosa TaxID=1795305 RepID=A0AAE3WCV1_9RHOB|nr:hypothetical protein [Marimonas arenosa]MDQ2089417.1 hypothetical protein [Marimonas arenosa]